MTTASPRRILLVYDGSSVADRALGRTIELGRERAATVTVLGVVPPRLWRARRGQFVIPAEKHDEEFAHDQIRRARQACQEAGLDSEGRVRTGPPVAVISEEAARGYELLVLASRANTTGAPSLAALVTVPEGCELVVVS